MIEASHAELIGILDIHGRSRPALLDILRDVQRRFGWVSPQIVTAIAEELKIPRVEVEGVVTFYAFLSSEPAGEIVIRLSNDVVDRMAGFDQVCESFCDELGVRVGGTSVDGKFTLQTTSCIGLCDQAPAALINDVPFPNLSSDKAREIVRQLRSHGDPKKLVRTLGDGHNAHDLVHAMVNNNVCETGPLIFSKVNRGEAIHKSLAVSPQEIIRAVKAARLRGRGGAGFPTGMKWEFTRKARGDQKYVICNADEGEPGTFKDRVILTERPDRVFAGMTIAGYAIGATEGILYLRGEYEYLCDYLEEILKQRREDNLLGRKIGGRPEFDFDIRIQVGAGAYICGEETSLISSCEGYRGDPKNRPPFPAQEGYLGCPTSVNNVETLCCVTKILEIGPASFASYGNSQSTGTKLLSISGDCHRPGVYELPFGLTLRQVLEKADATDAAAVLVGGPSGQLLNPEQFDRKICFDDLATGGAIVVFGADRDLLEIVHGYMEFFVEESCGYCTPCRVGNVLLVKLLERILSGQGEAADLDQMIEISETMKATSRCGLGQTSSHPVKSSLDNFRSLYEDRIGEAPLGQRRSFDLASAVAASEHIVGRKSVHVTHNHVPLSCEERN